MAAPPWSRLTVLLDASAVLAWLFREPGAREVRDVIDDAFIPSLNWAEVLQKARDRELDAELTGTMISAFGLAVVAVDAEDASRAAALWERGTTLSLADRFCLAVGDRLDLPVWTCDRAWADVSDRVVVLR